MTDTRPHHTVGVFDSGFGGLTVLRTLLTHLPGTRFIYLGDTARLPYGAKSQLTVARYAMEAARFLVREGAQLLVIACNTATALALPEIRAAVTPIPVLGVIQPGAEAALAAATISPSAKVVTSIDRSRELVISTDPSPQTVNSTKAQSGAPGEPARWGGKRSGETPVFANRRTEATSQPPNILVLATTATVASHAYRDTCATLNLHATEMPCPLLVPLVEEGWTDHPVTRDVLRIYLTEALARIQPAAVLLGCTHYPLIASAITQTLRDLGSHAPVIDSAQATAQAARQLLSPSLSAQPQPHPIASTFTCFATDSVEKFARLGTHFLGQPIPEVHLLDLGG